MTYDFFLPGLVIDAIENHTGEYLARWAKEERDEGIRTVNMLGCHDGIPLLDLKGLLPMERIQALIDLVVSRGGLVKSLHGQKNLYYQVNATYYSALGGRPQDAPGARFAAVYAGQAAGLVSGPVRWQKRPGGRGPWWQAGHKGDQPHQPDRAGHCGGAGSSARRCGIAAAAHT